MFASSAVLVAKSIIDLPVASIDFWFLSNAWLLLSKLFAISFAACADFLISSFAFLVSGDTLPVIFTNAATAAVTPPITHPTTGIDVIASLAAAAIPVIPAPAAL